MPNRRQIMIVIIGILAMSLTLIMGGCNKETLQEKEVLKGTVNFENVEASNGEDFNPEEYKDKNVIITFVNSSCPYCDDQALHFKSLQENNDFELFYIPTNETDKQTIGKLDSLGVKDYNILIDRGQGLKKRLNVQTVPTSIIKLAGEDRFEAVVGVIAEEKVEEDTKIFKDYIR